MRPCGGNASSLVVSLPNISASWGTDAPHILFDLAKKNVPRPVQEKGALVQMQSAKFYFALRQICRSLPSDGSIVPITRAALSAALSAYAGDNEGTACYGAMGDGKFS